MKKQENRISEGKAVCDERNLSTSSGHYERPKLKRLNSLHQLIRGPASGIDADDSGKGWVGGV